MLMLSSESVAPNDIRAGEGIPARNQSVHKALGAGGKLAAVGAVILVVVAVATWWIRHEPAAIEYSTARVTKGSVIRTVSATGTVNPMLTIIIGSYVSGVISDMYCDYNTRVRKGQVCARVDARPYRAALDQARGQLTRDMAQLEEARVNLRRYAELDRQDSIARQTYEDQVALVHQLTGTVQVDRAAVQTAQVNLDYTNIVSPVDGTVVARNITIGQTVAASFQTPTLFLIATDLTRMQVDTNVSESDIGMVKVGDPAKFTVEAFSDRPFDGMVAQVRQAPQTVQNVVTYDVVISVDNADFLLKPGMTATVGIVADRRTDVLRVPDQALRFVPGGLQGPKPSGIQSGPISASRTKSESAVQAGRRVRVWILRDGKPAAVEIITGLDDDTYTEVVAGDLRPGDEIIIGEQSSESNSRPGALRFGG